MNRYPILERISAANVFTLFRDDVNSYVLTEACDCFLDIELTADELLQLSDELRHFALHAPVSSDQ